MSVAWPQVDHGAGGGDRSRGLNTPTGLPPLGGDLHYHLSQHGVFSEADMRFYAAEIILGLEHMHNRFVVYRDLKVRCRGPVPPLSTPGPPGPWEWCSPGGASRLPPHPLSHTAIFWIQVVIGVEVGGQHPLGPCPWTPVTL